MIIHVPTFGTNRRKLRPGLRAHPPPSTSIQLADRSNRPHDPPLRTRARIDLSCFIKPIHVTYRRTTV
ncbi:hypothetical protein AHF37_06696 [Paragonimus kellicotti]|nr:hypothetical protein AHF37_06696 [Paragonimus kellicotti]